MQIGQDDAGIDDHHTGVQIHVDDFTATYRSNGQPEDFVTHAELLDAAGRPVQTVDIRVNHPAEIDGVKFYQFGYGWAPSSASSTTAHRSSTGRSCAGKIPHPRA